MATANVQSGFKRSDETVSRQEDFEAYERELPRLVARHDGEFAVIQGREVRNLSPSYEEALTWGYEHYGLTQDFLVQEVKEGGDVAYFTRDLGSCRR
jgi:hypothetical protein